METPVFTFDFAFLLQPSVTTLWRFFTTSQARALRLVCKHARQSIAECRWADAHTRITGPVSAWRTCFPRAVAANISRNRCVADPDFALLAGLHTLDMSECSQNTVTDAAFAHLRGIHTLRMAWCSQRTITDAAFSCLRGVHTLNMSRCTQHTITDDAFAHLAGVHTLNMAGCWQGTITDAAFVHLRGIHTLNMRGCDQGGITLAVLSHLQGIHSLDMRDCGKPITVYKGRGGRREGGSRHGTAVEASREEGQAVAVSASMWR